MLAELGMPGTTVSARTLFSPARFIERARSTRDRPSIEQNVQMKVPLREPALGMSESLQRRKFTDVQMIAIIKIAWICHRPLDRSSLGRNHGARRRFLSWWNYSIHHALKVAMEGFS
jgi:hypothetical protein